MTVICKKCGYERQASDMAPEYQCPKCGAIYAKVDAYLKRQPLEKQKFRQIQGQYICTNCGYLGKPVKVTRGSIFIEIILWLAFLIPGLIYSLWRLTTRYQACPKCRHESMIPADSPRGQKLIREFNG